MGRVLGRSSQTAGIGNSTIIFLCFNPCHQYSITSVGVHVEPISGRILFSKLTELQAKVDVQTDRANNGSGLSFHEWNFSSERSFMGMYLDANVSGAGPAAFVDIDATALGYHWSLVRHDEFGGADPPPCRAGA